MSKNRNQPSNQGLDLVTPIIEILTPIVEETMKLIQKGMMILIEKLIQYIEVRYFNKFRLRPIKLKDLRSKKRCILPNTLGHSVNHKTPFYDHDINTRKHTAIIGTTGSGKTVCTYLLIERALKRGMPVIYFDPKASHENIQIFKRICETNNKKLHIFSDIEKNAVHFNPLSGGNLGDMSDKIINALEWSEPFYKNESIEALDEILQALTYSHSPITLETITLELKKHKNLKNIKGLYNQLKKVVDSEYGPLLNSKESETLTFNRLRIENSCLYIGISAMGHSSTGTILNKIFFGGLLTHAKESLICRVAGLKNPEEKPVAIFFDELSSTIHIGFIDLQNKCRQAGMEITYATQGPSDLDRISPSLTSQIFENTNNLFIFNQMVPAHTEFFARMFGTINTEKKTHVIDNDQKQNIGTVREVEEFLVHSNIIRSLRVGQCVTLQREPKRIDLLNVRHWQPPIADKANTELKSEAKTIF